MVSRAPSAASCLAMTRPRPRDPPVITTDLPANSYGSRRRHICAARTAPAPTAPTASNRFCFSLIAMRRPFAMPMPGWFDQPDWAFALSALPSPVMLPAKRTDVAHDQTLQSVVDRLTGGIPDRPDSPDGWVTAVRRMAPRAAEYAGFPDGVDERLMQVLAGRGIAQLYTHQAAAVAHALAGRNVVITTPTASGKTLCYNAPVLSA